MKYENTVNILKKVDGFSFKRGLGADPVVQTGSGSEP